MNRLWSFICSNKKPPIVKISGHTVWDYDKIIPQTGLNFKGILPSG
ncbi:hypothetical protein [Moraxella phage Mcat4]|nr:hypothetical protein [Moraxella phage Mcat4]